MTKAFGVPMRSPRGSSACILEAHRALCSGCAAARLSDAGKVTVWRVRPRVQSALEGWVRSTEAGEGGQQRSKEEAAAEALAELRAALGAHEQRAAALQGA